MMRRTLTLLAVVALVAPAVLSTRHVAAMDRAPLSVDDADRLLLTGEYRKAADAYREIALSIASTDSDTPRDFAASLHARRALAFVKRDDVPAAVAAAEDAFVASPNADSHAVRAVVRFRAGRFRAAADDVERTNALATAAHPLAALVRARLALSEGRAADALEAAEKCVGDSVLARAVRTEALIVRADALDELGRDRESVASLDAALAASPRTNELLVANLSAQLEFRRSLVGRKIYAVREPKASVDLPMVFVAGLPVVNMSMNGAPAVPFIVDTGAGICVVFSKYAKQSGFTARDEPAYAGAVGGNGRVPIRYGVAEKVALGDAQVDVVPMIRIDWELPNFGGIIGLPLLRQFRSTFDYPSARLRLEKAGSAASAKPAKGTCPFRLIGQGVFVETTLNGKGPFNFELDTGAASPGVPVDDSVALSIGLRPNAPGIRKGRGQGAAGSQDTVIHPGMRLSWAGLPEMKLDAIVQRISPARADRRDGESGISTDTELEGLIGFAALKTYAVTIDFTTWTIVLR